MRKVLLVVILVATLVIGTVGFLGVRASSAPTLRIDSISVQSGSFGVGVVILTISGRGTMDVQDITISYMRLEWPTVKWDSTLPMNLRLVVRPVGVLAPSLHVTVKVTGIWRYMGLETQLSLSAGATLSR